MAGEIKAILWDIDGTLITTGGAGAVAWQRAFEELYGVEANIDEHTRAGMTDPEITEIIFAAVVGRPGTPEERAKVVTKYLEYMPDAVAESSGYRVMPGIAEILPRLADEGVLQGIVSGNVEPAARIKLARGDLDRYFSFGGYGSDDRDRVKVTERAIERGEGIAGAPLDRAATISVGDTPRDVSAGHGAGIRVVGVATGAYSVAEQEAAGADWAIADVTQGFPA
ncbi:MAG TPA: HAD family hydrolase [Solirubrobacterales bacterium]|jgi:phosphoglycolate phosphatase-like HAD superfamily hydrolase|nr:HAD family hydrolase [Solirubrobacterales bacterium]